MNLSDQVIQQAWEQGRVTPGYDDAIWRKDGCGAWIERPQYNQANAEFGWHIRSIVAGSEAPEDLRPFHIDNEYSLASHEPHCLVTEDRTALPSGASVGEPRNKSV